MIKFIDGNDFSRTEIDRRGDQVIAVHDHIDSLDAIGNVRKAAGLTAVTPNLDLPARQAASIIWVLIRMLRRHSTRKPLDKPHSAHISGQIVNFRRAVAYALTGLFIAAVEAKIFHFREE
jgi:hypothetical protein